MLYYIPEYKSGIEVGQFEHDNPYSMHCYCQIIILSIYFTGGWRTNEVVDTYLIINVFGRSLICLLKFKLTDPLFIAVVSKSVLIFHVLVLYYIPEYYDNPYSMQRYCRVINHGFIHLFDICQLASDGWSTTRKAGRSPAGICMLQEQLTGRLPCFYELNKYKKNRQLKLSIKIERMRGI